MEFWRQSIRLLDVAPGTVVHLCFIGMKPESGDEARFMEPMKKLKACGEVEYVGDDGTTMKHVLRPLMYPSLEGRIFFTMQVKGREKFLVFTREAANLFFGVKLAASGTKSLSRSVRAPARLSPIRFQIGNSKLNGHRCVTIVTEDGQRGMRLACHDDNLLEIMDLFFLDAAKRVRTLPVDDCTETRYGTAEIGSSANSGGGKRRQVSKMNGRPVRARTADLHRVNKAVKIYGTR